MNTWKALVIPAAAAALVALAAPASAYLPPHGAAGKGGGGGGAIAGKKPVISIDGDFVTISGKKFSMPIEEKEVIALWGKPDRTADLANRILTWDDLGIYLYIRPKDTAIHALAVAYSKYDLSFWPKKNYTGKLTLDGAEVTAKSTVPALEKAKKGNPFEKSLLPDTWKVVNKKTSVYVRHRPDPDDGLIDVEIGIDPDSN
jgi:hypothetical protein